MPLSPKHATSMSISISTSTSPPTTTSTPRQGIAIITKFKDFIECLQKKGEWYGKENVTYLWTEDPTATPTHIASILSSARYIVAEPSTIATHIQHVLTATWIQSLFAGIDVIIQAIQQHQQHIRDALTICQKEQIRLRGEKDALVRQRQMLEEAVTNAVEKTTQQATKDVQQLTLPIIAELCSMRNPPDAVKLCMEALCALLGKPHSSWTDIRVSCKSDDFVSLLVHFDVYTADPKHVEAVRKKYVETDEWNLQRIDRASTTCGIMARFLSAQMDISSAISRLNLGPLQQQLRELEQQQSSHDTTTLLESLVSQQQSLEQQLILPFQLTRVGGDIFANHIGEYVLAYMLQRERHIAQLYMYQQMGIWARPDAPHHYSYRTLKGLRIGILGASGYIGNHIAKMVKMMGCYVIGVASQPRSDPSPHVDQWFYTHTDPITSRTIIPSGFFTFGLDYMISALPSTIHTRGLLRPSSFAQLDSTRHTCFINVGRGDVIGLDRDTPPVHRADGSIDTDYEIVRALDAGHLHSAVLDVLAQEPLPSDHPLWSYTKLDNDSKAPMPVVMDPRVIITPHVSAMSQACVPELAELFLRNLQRIQSGLDLLYPVDLQRGY